MHGSSRIQRIRNIKNLIMRKSDRDTGRMDRREFLKLLAVGAAATGVAASGIPTGCAELIPGIGKDFGPACGIIPPMVTPFTTDGAIDWNAYERLIDWHISKGVTGLFIVCGSGQYYQLTEDEAVRMAEVAVRRANGRIHILCGSTNHPRHEQINENISMTRRVAQTGVDGCFVTPPAQVPPSFEPDMQERVQDYLVRIHDATDCTLFIYEIPAVPFGFKFAPETLGALSRRSRYVGMKDTSTREELPLPDAVSTVQAKLAAVGDGLKIIQASNKYLLASLRMGCSGGINTVANVAPGLYAKMYTLWRNGDTENAERMQARIIEVQTALESSSYDASEKLALAMMGLPVTTTTRDHRRRGSNQEATPEQREHIRNLVTLIQRVEHEFEIN